MSDKTLSPIQQAIELVGGCNISNDDLREVRKVLKSLLPIEKLW